MRVVSLLPAATEIVMALGGGDLLVGVSHECDYPPAAGRLPRVTSSPIDSTASSGAIDADVRRLRESGHPVIVVDADELARLSPDLVVTQGLCEVCAVADGEVHRLARLLQPPPTILSLAASTLSGIWEDIRTIGHALNMTDEAEELVAGLRHRLVRLRGRTPANEARMLCIEWLDPLYLAGHWVPELVAAAGGFDVGAVAGSHSTRRTWSSVLDLRPDIIVVMLCGFSVERARDELRAVACAEATRLFAGAPVWIIDGNAFTSRPGPRVVDGAERLRAAMEGREMPGLERWHPAA
jgi:iron complex transport system substrate-binding protein